MAVGDLQQFAQQEQWRAQVRWRFGSGPLSMSATTGFAWVPTVSGVPIGTPGDSPTGLAPVVIDAVNYRLYFFAGGAWRNAGP